MRTPRLIVALLVAGALAAAAGALAARKLNERPKPVTVPSLVIEPRALDFGEVWDTEQFEWSVPVQNVTKEAVSISASESSCSCVAGRSAGTLAPNGSGVLKLQLNLRQWCGEPRALRDAKIQVTLSRDTVPGERLAQVELHGRVKSAIAVQDKAVDFGRLHGGDDPGQKVVPIRALVGLRALNVSVDQSAVRAELVPVGSDKWELRLHPDTRVPGAQKAQVTISPVTSGGEAVPPTVLPVEFEVLRDVQPDTSLVSLGTGVSGERLQGVLVVSSLSGRAFPRPNCEASGLTVRAGSPGPQVSHRFEFEHVVGEAGNHVRPVVLRGTDASGVPFEFRIEAHWYGVSP